MTSPLKARVILNPGAGALDPSDGRREAVRVGEALLAAGIRAELASVSGEHVAEAVRAAVAAGTDLILVGGGDGTIGTAAGALLATPAGRDSPSGAAPADASSPPGPGLHGAPFGATVPPLGILPLGTRNHFARDLGIPTDLEEAARVAAAGHVASVDLGEVNGRVFLNNASLGVYPRVVEERERREDRLGVERTNRLVRAAFTLRAAAAVLPRLRLLRADLEVDGRGLRIRTPFVFVGNNRYESRLLAPPHRPRLDAGELELVVAREAGAGALLALAFRSAFGRLYQAEEVRVMPARTVRLEVAGRRRITVAVDGEVVELDSPLVFRSRPGALRVVAPGASGPAVA